MSDIEELEERIEELREAVRRSRRLMRVGRLGALAGLVLFLALFLGFLDGTPLLLVASVALGLGGVVLTGSSRSSTEELERALGRVEAQRLAVIDGLDLVDLDAPRRS
jgi:Na+/H+ antiporter NhaD/arsenite permease-like protein